MFPNFISGPEGAQFKTTTNKRFPFGTKLMLQDGREFRYAEIGGTNIATARLCQAEVPGANFDELAVAAAAVGARAVSVTNGATTIADGLFDEGFLNVEDDAGEGHLYKIADHDAESAGSAAFEVRLAHGLIVAWTASTTVGLSKHPMKDIIIHPSPNTAALVGVTPTAINANLFGWVQVKGPASVLTDGTIVIGDSVMASDGTDGAVEAFGLTEGTPNAEITPIVGQVAEVAATTEESLIILNVPGFQ